MKGWHFKKNCNSKIINIYYIIKLPVQSFSTEVKGPNTKAKQSTDDGPMDRANDRNSFAA